jgi:hypothetical protein
VKKTRQNKNLEPGFDSIRIAQALTNFFPARIHRTFRQTRPKELQIARNICTSPVVVGAGNAKNTEEMFND